MRRGYVRRVSDDDELSGVLDTIKTAVTPDWRPDWLKNMPAWVLPAAAGFLAGWLIMGRRGGD